MLYHVYKQNIPSVVAKGKSNYLKMYDADLQLVNTIFVESGCPIEAAKEKGYEFPIVECVNGYDPETGKPRK